MGAARNEPAINMCIVTNRPIKIGSATYDKNFKLKKIPCLPESKESKDMVKNKVDARTNL
jgi:hypothetical protein